MRQRRLISSKLAGRAEAFAMVGLTVAAGLFFAFLPSTRNTFPTLANFQALAGGQAVLLVATLAVLVPLICDEFDLSVGANLALSGVLSASAMSSGEPLAVGVAIGVISGMAVGAINGLLVVRARVNAVVVTLGIATILEGIVQAKTKGVSITTGIPTMLLNLGTGTWFGVPIIVLVVLLITTGVYYVLAQTPHGRQLYMLGANRDAAQLVGVRTNRLLFSTFVLGGALAGAAGVLQVARAGAAVPTVGLSFTLPAFAGAFLGAAAIKPGQFNVWGAAVAIAFLATITGGLNLAGVPPYVGDWVNGAALIAGVALGVWLRRSKRSASPRDQLRRRAAGIPRDSDGTGRDDEMISVS